MFASLMFLNCQYNKSQDRTFEINMIFYALVNMMAVLVLRIAVTP